MPRGVAEIVLDPRISDGIQGFLQPLWVRRFRCPDCGAVYTLRPDTFARGFRYSFMTILSSLVRRITGLSLLPHPSRQAQQHWYRGLRLQSSRTGNVPHPGIETLNTLLARDIVPFTHSFQCAILRL